MLDCDHILRWLYGYILFMTISCSEARPTDHIATDKRGLWELVPRWHRQLALIILEQSLQKGIAAGSM